MQRKKIPLLRVQILFAAGLLAAFLLARFAFPAVYAAACEAYADAVTAPPFFSPDGIGEAVRQAARLLTRAG